MNQILYTGGKNKGSKMSETQKIIIFSVIFIIIFAICLIAVGANLLNKVKTGENNNVAGSNVANNTPTETVKSDIKVEFESEVGGVKVIVTSTKEIKTFSYWWDEEEPTTVDVLDTVYETIIKSKQGTHKLNVEVTDEVGNIKTEEQTVIGDSGPELTLSTDRISNYIIKAKDDGEIKKVVIVLNGETEEIEVNSKEFEYKVPIPQGYSLIEVTVYNINGITTTKKGQITNFGG